ncbi:GNAT family N-acetyltransferase [Stutzerimonas zhaodongensis]|uniref:GNAT family N-acetyltransferase n=1 Tax=Stutzerimonas zhaodongensis TaxID=1176257 RepID=UPI0021083CD0|nr:GNAT family N-acetyltransferase [Stutzerimonas zhaodongensis]MCQ2031580.1 GNAT family N-acetyltransferase [Stutzerimonas zhaodongensis]
MSNVEIRPVTPADHSVWLQLWQAYLHFYDTELPAETSALAWQRFLDPTEPTHATLAWRGNQAIGLGQWIFHRSNWTVSHNCYLQDLFVQPDVRCGGVGRQLIEHVLTQARNAGSTNVHWLTQATNHTAMRLYDQMAKRSGFVQYRHAL